MKKFLKFNWLSKKFYIRSFLFVALIAQIHGLYCMIKSGKPDYVYIGSLTGTVGGLLAMYNFTKVKMKKQDEEDPSVMP